jgi:hypothetical protein
MKSWLLLAIAKVESKKRPSLRTPSLNKQQTKPPFFFFFFQAKILSHSLCSQVDYHISSLPPQIIETILPTKLFL